VWIAGQVPGWVVSAFHPRLGRRCPQPTESSSSGISAREPLGKRQEAGPLFLEGGDGGGEAMRPRRMPAEHVPAQTAILQARTAGFTFREIAEQVGISTATVYRLSRGGATVDPKTQAALDGLEFVEPGRA
jgi:hypothetical protein